MVKIGEKFKNKAFLHKKGFKRSFEKFKKLGYDRREAKREEVRLLFRLRQVRKREAVLKSLRLFFKRFIYKGLGLSAFRIAKQFCYLIKRHYKRRPLKIFHRFLQHTLPLVQLRTLRKSGITHLIPFLFRSNTRPVTLAVSWFLKSVKERRSIKRAPFTERLAIQSFSELQDVLALKGLTIAKRQAWHRLASRNSAIRYFARRPRRYRWRGLVKTVFDNPFSSREFVYSSERTSFIFSGFWYAFYLKRLRFLRKNLQQRYYQLRSFFLFTRLQLRRSYYVRLRSVFLGFKYILSRTFRFQIYRFSSEVCNPPSCFCKNDSLFLRFLGALYFKFVRRLSKRFIEMLRNIRRKLSFRRMLRNISIALFVKFRKLVFWKRAKTAKPKGLVPMYSARRNHSVIQHLARQNVNTDNLSGVRFKKSFREMKRFFKTFGKILFNRSKKSLFLYRAGSYYFTLLNCCSRVKLNFKWQSDRNFEDFLAINFNNSQKVLEGPKFPVSTSIPKFNFVANKPRKRKFLVNAYKFIFGSFSFFKYQKSKSIMNLYKNSGLRSVKNKFNKLRELYQKFIDERHLPRDFKRISRFKNVKFKLHEAVTPVGLSTLFSPYPDFWLPSFYLYFRRFSEYFRFIKNALELKPTFKVLVFFNSKERKHMHVKSFEDFYSSYPPIHSLLELIPDWRLRTEFVDFFSQSYFKPTFTKVKYLFLEYWNKYIVLYRYFGLRQFKSGLFFLKFRRICWLLKRKKLRLKKLCKKLYKKAILEGNLQLAKELLLKLKRMRPRRRVFPQSRNKGRSSTLPFMDLMFLNFQYWKDIRPRLISSINPPFSWFHKHMVLHQRLSKRGFVIRRSQLRKQVIPKSR